jgi:hypothetical protein
MKHITAFLVIFALHHELTEMILTTKVTSNEQNELDSSRNRGVPPKFYFIREEASR